jgi:cell division protein FtsW
MVAREKKLHKLWRNIWHPLSGDSGPHQPDYVLLILTGIIIFFGLLMLSSATSVKGFQEQGDTYYFIKQQITRGLIPGAILYLLFIRIPFIKLKKFNWLWLAATLVLLTVVFIPGLRVIINGSKSWVSIAGVTLQTSEMAKLTFIIYLAIWLESKQKSITDFRHTFIPFLILLGIVCGLILLQPDMGTMLIFLMVATIMYFTAGMKLAHIGILAGLSGLVVAVMVKLAPYRLERLVTFLHPDFDTQGAGYQLKQALIAVGSGGWFGLGLGQSRQKFNYLPEVAADSIFAIIAEEWGFIFCLFLLALYLMVCVRGLRIAKHAPDTFSKLVTTGIISWITIQSVVNIGAIIGVMPLTGLPLPFISLGGSNLAVVMMALAIVTNISKYTKTA